MNTKQLALVLGGVLSSLALPGCGLDVGDLNNPGLDQLENSPDVPAIVGAATGLLVGNRAGKGNTTGLVNQLGIVGREAYDFDGSDGRFVTELIQGTLVKSDAFGGVFWAANYANIRLGNIILHGLDKVVDFSDENRAAIRGFTHTIQALEFLTIIITHDTTGAVIDVDHPLGDPLGAFVDKAAVLTEIQRLLDAAVPDLTAGGKTFPFPLSAGYVGFDTPMTFLTFNRAIKARVAVYQKEYATALTALSASFIVDMPTAAVNFNTGVYYAFSLQTGDTANALINPAIYAHPKLQTEAQMNGTTIDARYTAKVGPAETPAVFGSDASLASGLVFLLYPSNTSSIPLIRNEELILLKAEALWFTGLHSEAVDELNIVRTGAGGLPPLAVPADDAGFTDALLYERRYSLMYEGGHRWIDLRRFNIPLPLDAPEHTRNIRWPIPQAECDARPGEVACTIKSTD